MGVIDLEEPPAATRIRYDFEVPTTLDVIEGDARDEIFWRSSLLWPTCRGDACAKHSLAFVACLCNPLRLGIAPILVPCGITLHEGEGFGQSSIARPW